MTKPKHFLTFQTVASVQKSGEVVARWASQWERPEIWLFDFHHHLFTGDTLERGARRSVAIEPVETMTDAFNRADCEAAIGLPPGASRSFRCGVQFEPVMPPLVAVGDAPGSPRTKVAGNG